MFRKFLFYLKLVFSGKSFCEFFYFPFDTSTPMRLEIAVNTMKKGCNILEKLGIKYCLTDGTLLGIIRDNQLIPYDTDIDVAVLQPVDTKKIEREFIRKGFKLGRKVIALNKVQQLVFYSQEEIIFDIIFYTEIGRHIYAFCERDFYFRHSANFYKQYCPCVFQHEIFYTPSSPKKWLASVYGDNWHTPIKREVKDWREDGTNSGYLAAIKYQGSLSKLLINIYKTECIL